MNKRLHAASVMPVFAGKAMPDHFIIDGYNLMKSDPELAMFMRNGLEYARESVIKRVDNAAGLKRAVSITIVFDGHLNGQPSETRQRRGRLLIIYSKLGQNADAVIQRLLTDYSSPDQVKVITRDWELKDSARQAGQTSGFIQRRPIGGKTPPSGQVAADEGPGWNSTTKKKGPARRAPKRDRKKGPGPDVYW